MERFTDSKGRKKPMTSSVEAYKRLAAYEELGLTPEQVMELVTQLKEKTNGEVCKTA